MPVSPPVGALGATALDLEAEGGGGRATAGAAVRARLSFSLGPGDAAAGDSLALTLPGFRAADESASPAVVGVDGGAFAGIWDRVGDVLTLTALSDGAAGGGARTALSLSGLVAPAGGVIADDPAVTLRSDAAAAPTVDLRVGRVAGVAAVNDAALECDPSPCGIGSPSEPGPKAPRNSRLSRVVSASFRPSLGRARS